MKAGDRVLVTYGTRSVVGELLLCTENQKSLLVTFNGMLGGHVGAMPLLMDDHGTYRSIINDMPVSVTPSVFNQ